MSTMTEPGGPIPLNLGRCVDLYHDVRQLRLTMEKEAERVKERESELREHIIANLSKTDERGAVGMRYMARVKDKTTFRFASSKPDDFGNNVSGWGIFCSWVRKNDAFHFLQKRLTETAVAEMLERAGRVPPGVEKIIVPDISVTKV